MLVSLLFFFFKQKTAYEMRISDWSSDVCSSDLLRISGGHFFPQVPEQRGLQLGACFRQMQKLLTAVPGACCGLDIAPLEKVIQYAPERLFGDCQQFQQFADRQARLARDKITRSEERRGGKECGSKGRSRRL